MLVFGDLLREEVLEASDAASCYGKTPVTQGKTPKRSLRITMGWRQPVWLSG